MATATPGTAVVVGAGVVGLSCAWHLQQHGIEVTVLDRSGVAAGASWGNAGFVAPALTVPLAEPSVLREAVRGLGRRDSPLAVAPAVVPRSLRFLSGFARHATPGRWRAGLAALAVLSRSCVEAFDELAAGGVDVGLRRGPLRVGLERGSSPDHLEHELSAVRAAGLDVTWTERDREPPFSGRIGTVVAVEDQRHLDPGRFVRELADAVVARGGTIVPGARARAIALGPRGPRVETWTSEARDADAVVVATGAWLPELGRVLGIGAPVCTGRGYSCSVGLDAPLTGPVYLPAVRVAVIPYGDRARLAGTMELTEPDAPFDRRRLDAVLRSAGPLLDGIDWADVRDPWVGPRPLTVDGLPLIGRTAVPGVHVAGGHGMWGLTLGPITGRLLARQVATGSDVPELLPFAPVR